MQIYQRPLSDIKPYEKNPRQKYDIQKVAQSIKEFGFQQPIVVDRAGVIIVGHGRYQASKSLGLETVPVVIADLSPEKAKAYRIADNKTNEYSDWDIGLLQQEFTDLLDINYDLELTGFDADELEKLIVGEKEGLTDEDAVPETPEEPKAQLGDIYKLGEHRLMCGDSTNSNQIELLMNGQKAKLLHADPPYGMGKEKDGVINDNLYKEKLDAFQMAWWREFRPHLKDNASAYIWGNSEDLWRLWFASGLGNSERLTFRNDILWKQEGVSWGKDGMANLRQYANMGEHCLFFMLGEQGFNNNADNYWEGWDFVVNYLKKEKEKSGLSIKDFKRIAGHSENSGCHWFDKSQWNMPTKEVYQSWQNYMKENNNNSFKKDYDELKKNYDELKKEFYSTRSYFDSGHEQMSDVWEYDRVKGEERQGHATPKPVKMMERVMKSSLPKGGLCIEPFGGSGSTLMGAEKTNRICYTMELDPKYIDVIIKRWEQYTGQKAEKIN